MKKNYLEHCKYEKEKTIEKIHSCLNKRVNTQLIKEGRSLTSFYKKSSNNPDAELLELQENVPYKTIIEACQSFAELYKEAGYFVNCSEYSKSSEKLVFVDIYLPLTPDEMPEF